MNAVPALLGLDAARPAAAWALLLPVAYLLFRGAWAESRTIVTGTFELWRDLASAAPAPGARALARPPRSAWIVAAALLAGALAWLGPRTARAEDARIWTCVLDRSPSLGLPMDGATRQVEALAAAETWLAEHARRGDRVRWVTPGREPLELERGVRLPAGWTAPDRSAADPDWSLHDDPGTLWITDRAPASAPRHAGLFASGGPAVPGAVAADGRESVVWDGRELVRRPAEGPARPVIVGGGAHAVPAVIARMVQAWADARGFAVGGDARQEAVLEVAATASAEPTLPVVFGRDGWQSSGRARALTRPAEGVAEDWLVAATDDGPLVLVRAAPGRIECALTEMSEPSGDPALFALSWAKLLDRCARAGEDVLPLSERRDAGPRVNVGGEEPDEPAGAGAAGPYVDAALALAAAFLAALGLFGGEVRARATPSRAATPRGASRRSA